MKNCFIMVLVFLALVLAENADTSFFNAAKNFNFLVDYEAYETKLGKETIILCENARKDNENQSDDTLRIYRNAVLDGFIGTILLKRNSYISGLAKTLESQKNWEMLIDSRFADEANFAVSLAQYYKMTLFNKTPKNASKLNSVIATMRSVVAKDEEVLLKLSLSYIWVLQEQKLSAEAKALSARFFARFPDNNMMLRAMQTIAGDEKNADDILFYSRKLAENAKNRVPLNYSDYLSAKKMQIFALGLKNKQNEACETARKAVEFITTIPNEDKKIYWVKKHSEAIEKEAKNCE